MTYEITFKDGRMIRVSKKELINLVPDSNWTIVENTIAKLLKAGVILNCTELGTD